LTQPKLDCLLTSNILTGRLMLLSEIITSEKTDVMISEWSDEKPKRGDFPLAGKSGGRFPLTRKWRWSTVRFNVSGTVFRIMVAYHKEVPEYQAVLGEVTERDTKVIARLEYHASHPEPGWHMHVSCEDTSEIRPGVMKPYGQTRLPAVRSYHRRSEYQLSGDSMNDNLALDIASDWFRFKHQTSLDL